MESTPENTAPRRRGRPFAVDADRRDAAILVKVNQGEQALIEAAAESAGMKMATWLREQGLLAAKRLQRRQG
jgi:hypothetical protein